MMLPLPSNCRIAGLSDCRNERRNTLSLGAEKGGESLLGPVLVLDPVLALGY